LGIKRRNGFEISKDILRVCLHSENKTRVVYRANLNSLRVNDYLEWLLKTGLLAKEKKGKKVIYRTTPMGLQFLKSYYADVDLRIAQCLSD
jgi:predicted transcriptional regulator